MSDPQPTPASENAPSHSWGGSGFNLVRRPLLLETPQGPLKLNPLKSGSFTAAYRFAEEPDSVLLVVQPGAADKELARDAADLHPTNPHLPRVEKLGSLDDGRALYRAPFYRAPFLNARANVVARVERQGLKECSSPGRVPASATGYERCRRVVEKFDRWTRERGVGSAVAEALDALVTASTNYSEEYRLEFQARNLATDAGGNLILLDVLYNAAALQEGGGAF